MLGRFVRAPLLCQVAILVFVGAAVITVLIYDFLSGRNFIRDLLHKRLGALHPALEPGALVDRAGNILGEHNGFAGFTVGQRKGLGGGFSDALFVLEIRPATREVVVGPREGLLSEAVDIAELNWLAPPPAPGDQVAVQLRYRAREVPATVVERGDDLSLDLGQGVSAVTPGQSAVVFAGERVLGGGRIARARVRA